jgi:acyl-CoA thioesterase 8
VRQCILAYISDFQFVGSAAQSVGLSHTSSPRLGMLVSLSSDTHFTTLDEHKLTRTFNFGFPPAQASLDHVVYWYSTTFKTSDWLLHVISAPRTGDGRGVVEGKFYTQEGELIAVTVQEGVVRAAPQRDKDRAKL